MGAATALPFTAFGQAARCLLALYQECITTGDWARLVFKTHGGDERIDYWQYWANLPHVSTQGSKRPANARRQNSKNTGERLKWRKGK
jgi:hypothetical protein